MIEGEAPRDFDRRNETGVEVGARQADEPDEDALALDGKGAEAVRAPLPDLPLQPLYALVGGEHAAQGGHDALVCPKSRNGVQIVAAHGAKVQALGDDL